MRTTSYHFLTIVILTMSFFFNFSSIAADMNTLKVRMQERLPVIIKLKSKGVIGENNKGYLEYLGNNREKESIVRSENQDRKEVYVMIAEKENVNEEHVGRRRALQIALIAKKGHWLQDQDGKWYEK
ncbi:MAG: YdbL family protein [Candidatus Brocadiaceae bacterium]|nr:YdbL family protein [Candidatus Brocadiaceae bacterium]